MFSILTVLGYSNIFRHYANNLPATESLSQVYKLKNQTYIEQCKRQLTILKLYYGDHLQLPIDDVSERGTNIGFYDGTK